MDILPENTRRIELTRGYFALVDEQDFEWLNAFYWIYSPTGYATRTHRWTDTDGTKRTKAIMMHRAILEYHGQNLDGLEADHIDRDRLNNTYRNLRVATRTQNSLNRTRSRNNTSGFTGVYYRESSKRWRASITVNGKTIELGQFENKEDAIIARKNAVIKYFGEYANLSDERREDTKSIYSFNEQTTNRVVRRTKQATDRVVRTKCPGVSWKKRRAKWDAAIKINGKQKHLGSFNSKEEAIAVRKKALQDIANGVFVYESKKPGKANKIGYPGICWNKRLKKWKVTIKIDSKDVHVGYYDQEEDAVIAQENAVNSPPEHFLRGVRKTPVRKNISGHAGIHWHNKRSKWKVIIVVNGKKKHLGAFDNLEDAIAARDKALITE